MPRSSTHYTRRRRLEDTHGKTLWKRSVPWSHSTGAGTPGRSGWIGADSAEFAVGIRSGLVSGRELSLFSGAGIVAGSTAEGEWAEIEQKIGDFTRMFGLEPVRQG